MKPIIGAGGQAGGDGGLSSTELAPPVHPPSRGIEGGAAPFAVQRTALALLSFTYCPAISRRMAMTFVKMHGCGNDFVILDERRRPLGITPARAAALADRHTGIGCDQLIVSEPGDPVFMRIYNPDGSEAGACGNATRCVADILMRETGAMGDHPHHLR